MTLKTLAAAALLATIATGAAAHSPTRLAAYCATQVKAPSISVRGVHVPSRASQIRRCIEEHPRPVRNARQCPKNAPILYRGNLICLKGR